MIISSKNQQMQYVVDLLNMQTTGSFISTGVALTLFETNTLVMDITKVCNLLSIVLVKWEYKVTTKSSFIKYDVPSENMLNMTLLVDNKVFVGNEYTSVITITITDTTNTLHDLQWSISGIVVSTVATKPTETVKTPVGLALLLQNPKQTGKSNIQLAQKSAASYISGTIGAVSQFGGYVMSQRVLTTSEDSGLLDKLNPLSESIVIDATLSESTKDEYKLTEHPVEFGSNIIDHVYRLPIEFTIKVGFSSTGLKGLIGAVSTASLNTLTQGTTATTMQEQYTKLRALQANKKLIRIVTKKRLYENMFVESIQVETDLTTENVLIATLKCRELIIAGIKTEKLVFVSTKPESVAPNASGTVKASIYGVIFN